MRELPILNGLAAALLAGDLTAEASAERCYATLGRRWRWVRTLASRFAEDAAGGMRWRHREVVAFLRADDGVRRAFAKYRGEIAIARRLAEPARMQPVAAAAEWGLPAIESVGALAEWLGVTVGELDWFADLKGLAHKKESEQLRHYRYRLLEKSFGAVRLIEAPKPRLKRLQQRILAEILDRVPAHAAVHGFVKGRSIKTFAAPHVGQRVVLRLDLRDFFPSISGPRIQTLFRVMGYPEPVADLLGGICTNAAPRVLAGELYARPHLPQGAPTSPALANMCAHRVDCRLQGLADSAGAHYTRYADDMAFSGGEDFEHRVERFAAHAAAIAMEEGFTVHHRKTRVMRQGVRQHLAGMVTNARLNVYREDYDRLKAILTNCVRHGVAGQNREGVADFRAHLAGRVAFVAMVHAERGRKLRELLGRIEWGQAEA